MTTTPRIRAALTAIVKTLPNLKATARQRQHLIANPQARPIVKCTPNMEPR